MEKTHDRRLLQAGGRLVNYRQRFGPDDPRVKAVEVDVRAIRAENAITDLLDLQPSAEVLDGLRALLGGAR